MNTAYSYKRFSSKQQMRGDSLRRQTALANNYCLSNNLTLSENSFEDLGVSAFRSGNASDDAGLGQFLLALSEGKIETPCYLLVESLDRLSRDNLDAALTQFMNIIQAGVIIVTLFDNRTYQKGMDVVDYLTALISMQRANEESRIKSQRISSVWRNRKDNPNAKKTKNCPFWLTVSPCRSYYEVNELSALVHRIHSLAQSGIGAQVIAQMLNAEGIKSPRGRGWTDTTILHLLSARTVLGEYQPKQRYNDLGERVDTPIGEPIKNYYPVIMSEEDFYTTQACVQSRAKSKIRGASRNFLNVIKGVASCGFCGSTIRLKKQPDAHYLVCSKSNVGICEGSNPINLRFLEDWLREIWLTSEYAPITAAGIKESKQLRKAEADLEKINNSIRKLATLLDDGDDVIYERIQEKQREKRETLGTIQRLKEFLAPYNITKDAQWERFTLVKTAFMQGVDEDILKARGQLTQLLSQLKGFEISMLDTKEVKFVITTPKDEQITYLSAIRPYHWYTKHTGKVWRKV